MVRGSSYLSSGAAIVPVAVAWSATLWATTMQSAISSTVDVWLVAVWGSEGGQLGDDRVPTVHEAFAHMAHNSDR